MGCLRGPEAAFDAFDHHVADDLAAEAGGGRGPADDLTVVAVEDEGDAHHLAVPAGELEAVRAPALVGLCGCDGSLMFPRDPPAGAWRQQQALSLHEAKDPLAIDKVQTAGSPLTIEQCSDPAVPIGRALVDEAADIGTEFSIALALLGTPSGPRAPEPRRDVRAGDPERVGDGLHREPPGNAEFDRNVAFFERR